MCPHQGAANADSGCTTDTCCDMRDGSTEYCSDVFDKCPEGADCLSSDICQSGYLNRPYGYCSWVAGLGTCRELKAIQEFCGTVGGGDEECYSGQCTCNKCVESDGLMYPGGPCRTDSQCQSSHYCSGASGVACTGTCVEKLGFKESCTFDDRCDSGQCTCNRCVEADGLVYPGGPCRVNSQCQSSYFCSGFTAGSVCSGACEYKLANGISCNQVRYGHDQCQSGWCYCWAGSCSCRAKLGQSQSCTKDVNCLSNNCAWGGGSCWSTSWCCA